MMPKEDLYAYSFYHQQDLDNPFVCVAMTSQYSMINTDTGYEQSLFPYDNENSRPLIKRVGKVRNLLHKGVSLYCKPAIKSVKFIVVNQCSSLYEMNIMSTCLKIIIEVDQFTFSH